MTATELIAEIRKAAFEVRQTLKPGFFEAVYQNALLVELQLRGFRAEKEIRIPVYYKGMVVGDYRADILVENRIIIEVKAVREYSFMHEMQLINYLLATGIEDGLVINFGDDYHFRHKTRTYTKGRSIGHEIED